MSWIVDWVRLFIDWVLHLDTHLADLIVLFGPLTYLILFLIVFCETGIVAAPFLPGDSLLFAAGVLASADMMNIWILYIVFLSASILGDTVNYWIGHYVGPKIFHGHHPLVNKEYLNKAHAFYEKHGGKTIILARFVPIIRTFAPFVAGIAKMDYFKFLLYNVVGGVVWVTIFLFAGYFFGNIPFVKEHFSLVIVLVIVISLIPVVIEIVKHKLANKKR